jgi:AraC-like DNA-binding protein
MPVHYEMIELPADQSFRLLRWKDNVSEVDVLTGPGQSTPLVGAGERWHAHPAMELTLVLTGTGTRFIGDSIAPVEPPELLLIGPDVPHYWRGLRGSSGYAIQFEFGPHQPLWKVAEASSLRKLWDRSTFGLFYTGRTRAQVTALTCAMADESSLRRLATLLRILDLMASAPEKEQSQLCRKAFRLAANDPHRFAIEQAIHLIVEESQEDLSLVDVARTVHMSRATFCRHFRRLTGKTFIEFLNDVRLDHARRLLVEGALNVGQVAGEVGFSNLSHFNRLFRKRMGQTPTLYAQANRPGAGRTRG